MSNRKFENLKYNIQNEENKINKDIGCTVFSVPTFDLTDIKVKEEIEDVEEDSNYSYENFNEDSVEQIYVNPELPFSDDDGDDNESDECFQSGKRNPKQKLSRKINKEHNLLEPACKNQCRLCLKTFAKACSLKSHQRVHTGEKPYQCKICLKTFTQSGNLNAHERIHTGERPFQCDICSNRFRRLEHLKKHEKVHTGEKPFGCQTCGKLFSRIADLQRHEKIHRNERLHQCGYCLKRFTLSCHLKLHIRTHTGERPYKCKSCASEFTQSHHLRRHQLRFHPEDLR